MKTKDLQIRNQQSSSRLTSHQVCVFLLSLSLFLHNVMSEINVIHLLKYIYIYMMCFQEFNRHNLKLGAIESSNNHSLFGLF